MYLFFTFLNHALFQYLFFSGETYCSNIQMSSNVIDDIEIQPTPTVSKTDKPMMFFDLETTSLGEYDVYIIQEKLKLKNKSNIT